VHHGRLDPGVALLNKPYRGGKADIARGRRRANTGSASGIILPQSTHPRGGANLSVQRVQYFSCGNEVDDWVFGVEYVDDGAQAPLTLLNITLAGEN